MFKYIISLGPDNTVIEANIYNSNNLHELYENEILIDERVEPTPFLTPNNDSEWEILGRDNETLVPKFKYNIEQHKILPRSIEDIENDLAQIPAPILSTQERLAQLEEALCEQDLATMEWQSTIEDALCELDLTKEELL